MEQLLAVEAQPLAETPPRLAANALYVGCVGSREAHGWDSFVDGQAQGHELHPVDGLSWHIPGNQEDIRRRAIHVDVSTVHAPLVKSDRDVDASATVSRGIYADKPVVGELGSGVDMPLALRPPGNKPGAPRPMICGRR